MVTKKKITTSVKSKPVDKPAPVVEDQTETIEPEAPVDDTPAPIEDAVTAPVEEAVTATPKANLGKDVKPTEPKEPAKADIEASPKLVRGLEEYVEAMNPIKPMTPELGVIHQKNLQSIILNALLDQDEKQAVSNILYILDFINKDTTKTFVLRSLQRYYNQVKWPSKEVRLEIEQLMVVFEATSNPKTRAKIVGRWDWSNLHARLVPKRAELLMRRLRIAYGIVN